MLCQDCRKREAQIHLTQIVNNEKTTLSLCRQCAEARGFHSPLDSGPFPLAEILSGLAKNPLAVQQPEMAEKLECQNCHQTFDEFTRQGRFGCGQCYAAFRPRLEPIMRKIHGASLHRGMQPQMSRLDSVQQQVLPIKEEERLENELRKAIEAEDFERAAGLRDKMEAGRADLAIDRQE